MKSIYLACLFLTTSFFSSAQCTVEAKFSYVIDGESLELTNTSVDEPDGADYFWNVGGYTTIAENPDYFIPDLLGDEEIEIYFFVDNLPEATCRDAIHIFIPREAGEGCPPSVPDFYYVFDAEEITFYNTSQFVEPGANIYWNIGGEIYEDDDESITFPLSDFEGSNPYSLHIDYTAEIEGCAIRTFQDSMIVGIESAGLVNNVKDDVKFELYPSPAKDVMNLSFDHQTENGVVLIYDLEGKIMQQHFIQSEVNYLQISTVDLAKGTYIVKVEFERGNQGQKQFLKVN